MEKLLSSDMVSDEQKNFWILETTRGGGSRLGTVPITLGCVYTLCMALANGLLISNSCQCLRTATCLHLLFVRKGTLNESNPCCAIGMEPWLSSKDILNLDLKIRLVTICDQMSSHPL